MLSTIPKPAALLLDLIGKTETSHAGPEGYRTVFRNRQNELKIPITKMSVNTVLANGPVWARKFGSSATGRYQIMAGTDHTLLRLKKKLNLSGKEIYTPNLQDFMGWTLLRERGFDLWLAGKMSHDDFMIQLAKEWASFPVPYQMQGHKRVVKRGQSYYSGDGKNAAKLDASETWTFLKELREAAKKPKTAPAPEIPEAETVPLPPPPPLNTEAVEDDKVAKFWATMVQNYNAYRATQKQLKEVTT